MSELRENINKALDAIEGNKQELKEALIKLLMVKLDSQSWLLDKVGAKKQAGYAKGDEDTPFFSEAFLYNLMGKDDARTILASLNRVCKSSGLIMYELEREGYKQEKEQLERR